MVVFFQEVKLLSDLGQCPLDKTFISWIAKVAQNTRLSQGFQLWEFRGKSFVHEQLFPRLSCSQYWSVSAWVLCANLQSSWPLSVGHCGDRTFNQVIPMKWATGLCLIQLPSSPPLIREPHKRVRSQAGRDSLHMEGKKLTCKPGKEVGEFLLCQLLCSVFHLAVKSNFHRWCLLPRPSGPSNRTC